MPSDIAALPRLDCPACADEDPLNWFSGALPAPLDESLAAILPGRLSRSDRQFQVVHACRRAAPPHWQSPRSLIASLRLSGPQSHQDSGDCAGSFLPRPLTATLSSPSPASALTRHTDEPDSFHPERPRNGKERYKVCLPVHQEDRVMRQYSLALR